MITLIPKGVGKPDYTADISVSTSPVVIRHQATGFGCVSVELPEDTGFDYTIVTSHPVYLPPTLPEFTMYYNSFNAGFSKNVLFEYVIGIVDFDKVVEADAMDLSGEDAINYIFKKIYLRGFAYGSINITLPINTPIVCKFNLKENEPSNYCPDIYKYTMGVAVVLKTDENLKGYLYFASYGGLTDKYPWWTK